MDKNEALVKIQKEAVKENIFTLLFTVVCVSVIAFTTKSLHCPWGLLILLNMNNYKIPSENNDSDKDTK